MLAFFQSRRSTRKYRPDMIPEDSLLQILEAGRCAPSGGNNQSTHYLVIRNPQVLDRLKELVQQEFAKRELTPGLYKSLANAIRNSKRGGYVFTYNAPVLVVLANQIDYGNAQADCSTAAENMMLMANALDLGSCWINQLKWLNENPVLLDYLHSLGMAGDEKVYCSVALGYADTEDGLPVRSPLPRNGNPVTWVD